MQINPSSPSFHTRQLQSRHNLLIKAREAWPAAHSFTRERSDTRHLFPVPVSITTNHVLTLASAPPSLFMVRYCSVTYSRSNRFQRNIFLRQSIYVEADCKYCRSLVEQTDRVRFNGRTVACLYLIEFRCLHPDFRTKYDRPLLYCSVSHDPRQGLQSARSHLL